MEVQPPKALSLMVVTPAGIVNSVSAVHCPKAPSPMQVRLSSSVTEVSEVQP